VVEPVETLNSRSNAEVADGQDVGAIQVDQQKHVGGPPPEAFGGSDLGANRVVRKLVQPVDLELARNDVLGERPEVVDLHPGEPHAPEAAGIQRQHLGGRGHPPTEALAEPSRNGPRSVSRNLLADDRVDEHAEGITQGASSAPGPRIHGFSGIDEPRQLPVTGLQGGQCAIAT